ncbi:MAG: hypothetical protein B7Z80_21270 [Rhodospirillales bacterium 20-64-7]|nr:MAG: hypothetical protein B7Z80_21270 [Rhodospirillales bacterium 20-64-7]
MLDNPSRRLILHAGPPKTGTTAVQEILAKSGDPSVFYPRVGLWHDGAHHNLVFNFYQDFARPEVERQDPQAMFAQIGAQARASTGNIVISSEAFGGRDVGAFLRALLPHFGGMRLETEILLVCRDHFARAASLYNQYVKDETSAETREPGAVLIDNAEGYTYQRLIEQFQASGFPVRVMNYHPAQDFLPRFFERIGFAGATEIKNERHNVSLSIKGLIATLAANRVARSVADRQRLFTALMRDEVAFFAPSLFIFDAAAVAAARPVFERDRQYLEQNFGLALPEIEAEPPCAFFLTPQMFEDIVAVTHDLGAEGEAIVDDARRYLSV